MNNIHSLLFILLYLFIPDECLASSSCYTQAAQDEGYQPNGDKYYRLYKGSDSRNFENAEAKCNEFSAHLAMYKNPTDKGIVTSYQLGMFPYVHMRVGLVNKVMTPECHSNWRNEPCVYWIDGTGPIDSTHTWMAMDWDHLIPCCQLNDHGHCGDFDSKCDVHYPFLCQLDCDNLYVPPTNKCPEVPSGYKEGFDGKYYKVTDNKVTFWDAMLECQKENARLAIGDTVESLGSIKYSVMTSPQFPTLNHWIGQVNPTRTLCSNDACSNVHHYINGQPWI